MDENRLKFQVGIFVVIAMLILAILIVLNSEGLGSQYTVFIKPTSAPGVTAGTPIRKNGILIGRVKSVTSEDDHVRLELGINEKERIFSNEVCSIGAESILGDAVVEFLPLPASQRGEPIRENHVMGKVALKRNPLEFVDMFADLKPELSETLAVVRTAGSAVNDAGAGISELTNTFQSAFNSDDSDIKELLRDFRTMSQKAQVSLDNFNRIFENVNNVVGDPKLKGQIRDTLAELPKIFQEVRVTVADTRKAINEFGNIPQGVNSNLENLESFTGALKEDGPEIIAQVKASLENADKFLENIQGFTKSFENLQNSQGTIGKLLNDTEIYDVVLRTVEEAKAMVSDLRRTSSKVSTKVEPLLNDLRIAADAVARDPGVLGVRGALDRRPGKTGYKGTAGRGGGLLNLRK